MTAEVMNSLIAEIRPSLSSRENEVLDCMLSGWNNRETAEELGIAEQTVKNHVNAIRRVLNVPGRLRFQHWIKTRVELPNC